MTKERYDFIDIAKGIGILAVIWAHILLVGWTHRIIYAFHMPLFFFISGFLYDENKYLSFNTFIKKRFKRLVVPYLIYSIVTWGIWALFRYIRHDAVNSYFLPLLQTVIAQGSGAYLVHNSALWFIPCLLIVEIMYYYIVKLGCQLAISFSLAIACLGIFLAKCYGQVYLDNMPWNLDAAFLALPFYSIGNTLKKYPHLLNDDKNQIYKKIIITFILIIFTFILSYYYGECSMGSSSYQCNELIFLFRAFIGIGAIIGVSILLSKITINKLTFFLNAIKWCGKQSLELMCIHIPIKGIVIILVTKLFKHRSDVSISLSYSFIAFTITMCISIIMIIFIINKLKIKFGDIWNNKEIDINMNK